MSGCDFGPMLTLEMYGQLLGWKGGKTGKDEALYQHFVNAYAKSDVGFLLTFNGSHALVKADGAYFDDKKKLTEFKVGTIEAKNQPTIKAFMINWIKGQSKQAEVRAKAVLKALLCDNRSHAGKKIGALLKCNALHPGKRMDKKRIMALCCMGPDKAINFMSSSIILGMDKIKAPTGAQLETETKAFLAPLYLLEDSTSEKLFNPQIAGSDAKAQDFYLKFMDFENQNKMRKELAILLMNCQRDGGRATDKGLMGLMKLRQIGKGDVLNNPTALLLQKCCNV